MLICIYSESEFVVQARGLREEKQMLRKVKTKLNDCLLKLQHEALCNCALSLSVSSLLHCVQEDAKIEPFLAFH